MREELNEKNFEGITQVNHCQIDITFQNRILSEKYLQDNHPVSIVTVKPDRN